MGRRTWTKHQYLDRHGRGHRFFGFGAILSMDRHRALVRHMAGEVKGCVQRSYTILAFLGSSSPRTRSIQVPCLRSYISQIISTSRAPSRLWCHALKIPPGGTRMHSRTHVRAHSHLPRTPPYPHRHNPFLTGLGRAITRNIDFTAVKTCAEKSAPLKRCKLGVGSTGDSSEDDCVMQTYKKENERKMSK